MRDCESGGMELLFSFGIPIGWRKDVWFQRGFVDLKVHKPPTVDNVPAKRT